MSNHQRLRLSALVASVGLSFSLATGFSCAQGVPLPGASSPSTQHSMSAPVPGTPPVESQPARPAGPNPGSATPGSYQQLPINVFDAQARLEELKALLPESRAQSLQEPINQLCEWLADMADAHTKLAAAFVKHDSLKPQADQERQTAHKFASLKNQAQLLKAELFIRQQRFPEALAPLVEIVIAEPKTATGQAAYKKLREIGFSEEIEVKAETQPATTVAEKLSKDLPPANAVPTAAPVSLSSAQVKRVPAPAPPNAHARPPAAKPLWFTGSPFGSGVKRAAGR